MMMTVLQTKKRSALLRKLKEVFQHSRSCKLHISVNTLTGQVIACDLTSKSARDASRVPALLKQIRWMRRMRV